MALFWVDLRSVKGWKTIVAMGMVLVVSACGSEPNKVQSSTRWNPVILEGNWINVHRQELETWLLEEEGACRGREFVMSRGDTVTIESMSLNRQDNAWVYTSQSSSNRPPVIFTCISESPNQLVFENKDYPFPQKITYLWGTLVQLRVYLEGDVDGRRKQRIVTYLKEE